MRQSFFWQKGKLILCCEPKHWCVYIRKSQGHADTRNPFSTCIASHLISASKNISHFDRTKWRKAFFSSVTIIFSPVWKAARVQHHFICHALVDGVEGPDVFCAQGHRGTDDAAQWGAGDDDVWRLQILSFHEGEGSRETLKTHCRGVFCTSGPVLSDGQFHT